LPTWQQGQAMSDHTSIRSFFFIAPQNVSRRAEKASGRETRYDRMRA